MTLTIHIPPEIEAGLISQARAQGLEVPQYVELVLRDQVQFGTKVGLSPAEREREWRESIKSLPQTPPLSDEAISRESIYSDRA
ncbi:MAG: hypothetical protein WBE76_26580 [Terracidiphilus sp.]